jgi:hypothetical protein
MIDFSIVHSKSVRHTFEFINHSTASIIQLVFNDELDKCKKEIWFDYQQFLELADFIEQLKEK